MARWLLFLGALNGLFSLALGAFGAHALRSRIATELFTVFQTAVQYHQVHALGLLAIGLLALRHPSGWLVGSGWLMLSGIVLFSGSLYLLAVTGLRSLGMVTPFGGGALLLAWLALCVAMLRLPATAQKTRP